MIASVALVVLTLGLIVGMPFALMFRIYGRSLWSQTVCPDCHVDMMPSGYVAHGFKRHHVCPLCRWDTYVTDRALRSRKERSV